MIKAIIFDMDGVIVNSEPLWVEAHKLFLDRKGLRKMNNADLNKFVQRVRGRNWNEIAKIIKAEFNLSDSQQRIINTCAKAAKHIFEKKLKPIPGAITLIKKLNKHGYPLALASSSPYSIINYIMAKYGIRKYFKIVLSGIEVPRGKPNPAIFLKTARLLKVKPNQTLVIEDSINGIKAAHRSGMKCIALKQPYTPYKYLKTVDLVVNNLNDTKISTLKKL